MGQLAVILAKRRSQEELEAEIDAVLSEATKGRSITRWSVGDSSADKFVWSHLLPGSRASILIEALCIVNPTEYPPHIFLPNKQTRVAFADPILVEEDE